jgi:UDP-2,3-diacylglucosamine hydrolase
VTFHEHPFHTPFGGRRALVAHGDGLGRGDLRYRALKAVLRSRPAILGFRALHPELGVRLAHAVSATDTRSETDEGARGRARFLEDWAESRLREDPTLGWVVCGHAHMPVVREVEPGRFYLNAGDWIRHYTYITIADGTQPALQTWPAQAARP